jgi:hypothetical protein
MAHVQSIDAVQRDQNSPPLLHTFLVSIKFPNYSTTGQGYILSILGDCFLVEGLGER